MQSGDASASDPPRAPVWLRSPLPRSWSNRLGRYDAWQIRPDGSGRTRLSSTRAGVTFPMFAPDGQRLVMGKIPSGGMMGTAP